MPSIVVTSDPSAWTASTVQLFTASPLRWTVHAPQLDVSQPTCVPVSPRVSRRKCTRSRRASTSWSYRTPFTLIETRGIQRLLLRRERDLLGSLMHAAVRRGGGRCHQRGRPLGRGLARAVV